MPTALDTTTAIQDKVLSGIQAGQNAVVDYVKAWAETVEATFSKLPELASGERMKPNEILDTTVGFTEKLLAGQREFASQLFQAAMPVTRAATATATTATKASAKS